MFEYRFMKHDLINKMKSPEMKIDDKPSIKEKKPKEKVSVGKGLEKMETRIKVVDDGKLPAWKLVEEYKKNKRH